MTRSGLTGDLKRFPEEAFAELFSRDKTFWCRDANLSNPPSEFRASNKALAIYADIYFDHATGLDEGALVLITSENVKHRWL